jgi:hypothetical protein
VSRGVLLLLLVASVGFAPAAPVTEAPRDLKQHLAFSEVILEEVEAHQYDLLETQYQQFKMPGELLPDGIEKLWIYFAAFYGRFQSIRTEEEGDAFVQSVRAWFTERPGSVAALLCLENALVGQLDWFWGRLREEKGGPGSAETVAKMDAIGEEYRRNFRDFPEAARAKVLAEPIIRWRSNLWGARTRRGPWWRSSPGMRSMLILSRWHFVVVTWSGFSSIGRRIFLCPGRRSG